MKGGMVLLSVVAALSGCGLTTRTDFPVTPDAQKAVRDTGVQIIPITPANIGQFAQPGAQGGTGALAPASGVWNYKVGVGDILDIVVWDHPELTLPAGPQRSAAESGARVQADGTFFYPYIGQVEARGRTPEAIRADIATRLAEFIPNPQVEVRVAAYMSQAAQVTGAVAKPSRTQLTATPTTLVDAINNAGGLTEEADPARVTILRDGKLHAVDFRAFLERGVAQNNPVLQAGDVVTVPKRQVAEAYLLGQISQPATVDLSQDPVSLTQALTRQGGLVEGRADARGIFVLRLVQGQTVVYQLDATTPVAFLLGTRFQLQPRDVVYVTTAPSSKWGEAIALILPTVRAVNEVQDAGL